MSPEEMQKEQSVIYLAILIIIEILVFILSLASNQKELLFFNFIRIACLLGTKCMQSISWCVQYIIFAFICALYSFDPVGLWIIGHGQHKTKAQNAFCVIIFIGLTAAVYIGYLFKKTFEKEIDEDFIGEGYSMPNDNAIGGGGDEKRNSYLYRQPQNVSASNAQRQQPKKKAFQQFSGQAYSLD